MTTRILFAVLSLLAIPQRSGAAVQFFEDEVSWMNAAVGPIQSLDLFDASIVALSNEVTLPPSPGNLLGTNILTFDTVNSGLNEQFILETLESSDIRFNTGGARPGLEPSTSGSEDFEQRIGGGGAFSIGFNLVELESGASWNVFDASDNLLGGINPGGFPPRVRFVGVVSDTPIVRTRFTHPGGENIAVGTHHFSYVPEPSGIFLAAFGIMASLLHVRSLSRS